MKKDDPIYDDGDSFSFGSKDKISFREIILRHLAEVAKHSFCEFRGGFWQHKRDGTGGHSQIYVQDSGEAYANAIDCMASMLYPHFDDKMEAAYKLMEEEISKAVDAHTKTVRLGALGASIENYYRSDQKPEDAQYIDDQFKSQQVRVMFRSVKLALKKRLFRDLCSFLCRKRYLEIGALND